MDEQDDNGQQQMEAEAAYHFALLDFENKVQEYGAEQVVYDLDRVVAYKVYAWLKQRFETGVRV